MIRKRADERRGKERERERERAREAERQLMVSCMGAGCMGAYIHLIVVGCLKDA